MDLADAASVPLACLRSVTRMAMTLGLFHEPGRGSEFISHSSLSVAFAIDVALRDWTNFIVNYGAPSAACLTQATKTWGASMAKNQTAYNIFAGTTLPFFDHVKQQPGMAEIFSRYMESQGRSEGARLGHLLDGFNWTQLGDTAHLVDVGGSKGFVSVVLANAYPGFTFTIQDLPEVISSPHSRQAGLSTTISPRFRFVGHDFFKPQPPLPQGVPTPGAYLLRKILHDWPTEHARHILSQLASAIENGGNPDARIIVMDTILPPPGTVGRVQEANMRVRDLTMLQNFNSKERELEEWRNLFESAVPKLELLGWKQPPGSVMAVMEVGLVHGGRSSRCVTP